MSIRLFEHIVPIPTDKRLKDVRAWLISNVSPADGDWTITVDMEVVEFFKGNLHVDEDFAKKDYLNDRFFVISFKHEEDKVKFILTFL